MKKRKILLIAVALLLTVGLVCFGIHTYRAAYAEVITWSGTFQETTTNWYYETASYADVTFIGNNSGTYTFRLEAGQGGFSRTGSGNTTVLSMDQDALRKYIRNQGYTVTPGDTFSWVADARITFGYNGLPASRKTYGSVDEAKANRSYVISIKDDSGKTQTYTHTFADRGYWDALKHKSGDSFPGVSVTVIAETGGTAIISGKNNTTAEYFKGDSVTVIAAPKTGYTFAGWYKDGIQQSSSQTYTFAVPKDGITLTAKFTKDASSSYTLTTKSSPSAGGTVEGNSGKIESGTQVSVVAIAADGYTFSGWTCSWSGFSGSVRTATFIMPTQNVTLTANFTKKDTDKYSVTFVDEFYTGSTYDGQGNGNSYYYEKGHEYTHTVKSTNSYSYNGTKGYYCTKIEVSPTSSGLSVNGLTVSGTLTGNVTITRTMVRTEPTQTPGATTTPVPTQTPEKPDEPETYTVSIIAYTGGSASGGGSYEAGETVFINASADYGYEFDYWGSSSVNFSSSWSSYAYFTMPAQNVIVFLKLPQSSQFSYCNLWRDSI